MTDLAGEAPTAAIGNLRFTAGGVYAEYLLSGRPFIFLPKEIRIRSPTYTPTCTGHCRPGRY